MSGRLHAQGKVRDVYRIDDERLLLVATDRISAFDVVLPNPIPDKGRVLTGLTLFWLDRTKDLVGNHLLSADRRDLPGSFRDEPALAGRSMLVKRAEVVPVGVARGYLTDGPEAVPPKATSGRPRPRACRGSPTARAHLHRRRRRGHDRCSRSTTPSTHGKGLAERPAS
jgi:hypothetical protein